MGVDTGSVIANRYELGALIGKGGMARVYRAKDRRGAAPVALKIVSMPADPDEASVLEGWVSRELKALMLLEHPGVLRLLDHGKTEDLEPFMALELLEGVDLKACVEDNGPLDAAALTNVALQALAGLQAAHDKSIAHRDLKPANLFLCRDGRVVLLDFGLARALSESVSSTLARGQGTKLIGTPQFLSPEQVNGVTLSLQSDLFSLGATFYFLLTGKNAFRGATPIEVITSIVLNRRSYLHDVAPAVPRALAQAIDALMQPEPRDRPKDAGAALQLFRSAAPDRAHADQALQRYLQKVEGATQIYSVAGAPSSKDLDTHALTIVHGDDGKTQITTAPISAPTETHKTAIATVKSLAAQAEIAQLRSTDDTARPRAPKRDRSLLFLLVGLGGGALGALALTRLQSAPAAPAPTPASAAPLPVPPPPPAPTPSADALPTPSEPEHVAVPKVVIERELPPTGNAVVALKQWAEVKLDGVSLGRKQNALSLPLAPGKHTLTFINPKYPPRERTFTIRRGQDTALEIDLASD